MHSTNDWGRTPFWVALERGAVELCRMMITAKADVNQDAVAITLPHKADRWGVACFGPGKVASGVDFVVSLFTPDGWMGMKFGHPEDNVNHTSQDTFVVVRSFGEAARNCIVP